jgi:hypothetical protein
MKMFVNFKEKRSSLYDNKISRKKLASSFDVYIALGNIIKAFLIK